MNSSKPGYMIKPQIIVLKEGTDMSQGKPQLLSNIDACIAIADIIRTTLGPRGMDKLIVNNKGKATISNDGATILGLLDVIHPAAKSFVDIARAQDSEVGDGTTSVVLLAGEIFNEIKTFIHNNISPHTIIRGLKIGLELALKKVEEESIDVKRSDRDVLERCACTSMGSKLIRSNQDFFKKLVVDAVMSLDESLDEDLIGIKKVNGGAVQDSLLVNGVVFKKTFSYAGFEQQPKKFSNPKVLALNMELELKAERDNAEIRIDRVKDYQSMIDAEWKLFYDKLDKIYNSGASIVLSKLPIGDLATQYFADKGMFCSGRVPSEDLNRVIKATGGSLQTSVQDLKDHHLGTCSSFEEIQIGGDRYDVLIGTKQKTCTFVLRGGSEQYIAEIERSIHDSIMVVKRIIQNEKIVIGGGALEMEVSQYLRLKSYDIRGKHQLVIQCLAKAFEIIPRQLCSNAGLDSIDFMNILRKEHSDGNKWFGVDVIKEKIVDNHVNSVWEPSITKRNMISSAVEAVCLVLSVDETIKSRPNKQ